MYSDNTLSLIKHFEGLHDGNLKQVGLQPKRCPAGIWTAGWGRALVNPITGAFLRSAADYELAVRICGNLTLEQASDWLIEDLQVFLEKIGPAIKNLNPHETGAVVSFTYNLGAGAFLGSTLCKRIKANDKGAAAEEFLKWTKATVNGKKIVLPGLKLRREAEKKLFETGSFP